MNWCALRDCDVANGEGVRVSLFVAGCRHRCPGCFNDVAWDFAAGEPWTAETERRTLDALGPDHVEGLSLLGGEPFEPENQPDLLRLVEKAKARFPEKSVWCWTGCVLERDLLPGSAGPWYAGATTDRLLSLLDVLVDGPYVEAERNLSLRFRGSANQRILRRDGAVWRDATN